MAPRSRAIPWALLSYLAIGLAALLPRVLNLGAFLNIDEAMFWMQRSEVFWKALRSGDYAATAISSHPGVTTMWLGGAGILLRNALFDAGIVRDETFSTILALTRLPTALVHVAAILLGYRLLRGLLPATAAFLAALLWAADPFVIGYSRVLHVDALASTFATLSLLAACAYWHHDRRAPLLILSGVCAGLAILSKSPALALLPAVGLIALAAAWRPPTTVRARYIVPVRSSVVPLLAWGVVVAVTVFVLWPALWVGPLRAYAQVRAGVEAEGAGEHVSGNFFLGSEDDRPGLLFYPVALALRLTPWALLGLLGLPFALRRAPSTMRRDIASLVGFVVLFVVAMSLFPNKLNRYLVPIFPTLDILAAIGIVGVIDFWPVQSKIKNLNSKIVLFVVVLVAVANAAWWHPYGIAYFNQVLGGAPAGARTFLIGSGEGMEQVAAWLNQQQDITGVVTVSPMVQTLQPYLRRGARAINPADGALPKKAGYVVVYGRQTQRDELFPPFDEFYRRAVPLYVISIHGADYARIYQVPPTVGHARPADFGPAIHLRGFTSDLMARRGQRLALQLSWEPRAVPPADYALFAHLIGPDGRRYAQADLPYPTSQWRPGRYVTTELPLAISAEAPPGAYQLVIGMYDPASGQRLPLAADGPLDPALDGPDALPLTELELK